MQRLFELADSHALTVKNAVPIVQSYVQTLTQPDRRIAHYSCAGLPQTPQNSYPKGVVYNEHNTPNEHTPNTGAGFDANTIRHFLDVRINALKGAQEQRGSRDKRVASHMRTNPNPVIHNPTLQRENLAEIETGVDSQLYNSKLLEKATDFYKDVVKRAPAMTQTEARELADDVDATLLDVRDRAAAETGKAAFVLEALAKSLENSRALLAIALGHSNPADKTAQIAEQRSQHTKKPGTAAALRRKAKADAAELERAEEIEARAELARAQADEALIETAETAALAARRAGATQNRLTLVHGPSPARQNARARGDAAAQHLEEGSRPRHWPVAGTDAFRTEVADLDTLDALKEFGMHYGLPMRQRSVASARIALGAL